MTGRGRDGFVLGLVVMMLFAISVAAATGYLVVNTEFAMSRNTAEGAGAAVIARAGLHRFASEQIGVVGDSVYYAIGNGIALVTSRKVMSKDSLTDLYYLSSQGTISSVLTPNTPATRVVSGVAWHHRRPLAHHGSVMITESEIWGWGSGVKLIGVDSSTASDCPGGGATPITGAIALSSVSKFFGATVDGNPDDEAWGNYQAMYDSVGLRWDVLSNANFPVEFEDSPPNFASLPADSFPVVRVNGDLSATNSWSGRGVLIVTGTLGMSSSFNWDGIILAGAVSPVVWGNVRGMLVGGLSGPNPGSYVFHLGQSHYYSCNVYAANESLSYLELIDNTVYEVN